MIATAGNELVSLLLSCITLLFKLMFRVRRTQAFWLPDANDAFGQGDGIVKEAF